MHDYRQDDNSMLYMCLFFVLIIILAVGFWYMSEKLRYSVYLNLLRMKSVMCLITFDYDKYVFFKKAYSFAKSNHVPSNTIASLIKMNYPAWRIGIGLSVICLFVWGISMAIASLFKTPKNDKDIEKKWKKPSLKALCKQFNITFAGKNISEVTGEDWAYSFATARKNKNIPPNIIARKFDKDDPKRPFILWYSRYSGLRIGNQEVIKGYGEIMAPVYDAKELLNFLKGRQELASSDKTYDTDALNEVFKEFTDNAIKYLNIEERNEIKSFFYDSAYFLEAYLAEVLRRIGAEKGIKHPLFLLENYEDLVNAFLQYHNEKRTIETFKFNQKIFGDEGGVHVDYIKISAQTLGLDTDNSIEDYEERIGKNWEFECITAPTEESDDIPDNESLIEQVEQYEKKIIRRDQDDFYSG